MIKKIIIALGILIAIILLLLQFKVLWVLAPYYEVKEYIELEVPIMDMNDYEEIWDSHRRPYIFSIKSNNGGEVYILGVEHNKDPDHPQLDSIQYYWNLSKPDVALVEGRVGNLFTWFQDPVKELGEGGYVTHLSNKSGVELFTWEPNRETEIELLMKDFPVEQIAMFYTFRPYFSNMRHGKPENPEEALQEYLNSRTDYPHLKGVFTSWTELDEKWKKDFPNIDWRDHNSGNGYPEGYLHDIWNKSNLARDEHMIMTIREFVKDGKVVFVTMGSSHAPRIEAALNSVLK